MPVESAHRATVRRYLLGEATEEEREALEREYFEDESALSRVESEEETLIEEYLAERLDARDRDLFEGRYLASPIHRQRVDAIRRCRRTVPPRCQGHARTGAHGGSGTNGLPWRPR